MNRIALTAMVCLLMAGGCGDNCIHSWHTKSDKVLTSAQQDLMEKGYDMEKGSRVPGGFFTKKHIVILTCSRCGKIEEIVNESP